jgi:tripartite-type tricarboxylate transporter receptor subunit TctC
MSGIVTVLALVTGHHRAGKLRILAVTTPARSPLAPDIPTIAESGLPGFDVTGWYGIVAPARTPKAIVAKLNVEIGKALKSRQVIDNLAADGADARYSTPEQLTQLVAAEEKKWNNLVKTTGMAIK